MAGRQDSELVSELRPSVDYPAICIVEGQRRRLLGVGTFDLCLATKSPGKAEIVSEVDGPRLPTAVIFHDSFMAALRPFLAQSFRRAVYVQGPFDAAVVAREKPDVVLDERVERYLDRYFDSGDLR
jgi:hypothetical protein